MLSVLAKKSKMYKQEQKMNLKRKNPAWALKYTFKT